MNSPIPPEAGAPAESPSGRDGAFFSAIASKPGLVIAAALSILMIVTFGRSLLPGRVPSRAGDTFQHSMPNIELNRRAYKELRAPLWDPHTLCGHPHAAGAVSAPFYPLSFVLAALPADLGYSWSLALSLVLSGLAMSALLGRWGYPAAARAVGAAVYAAGGMTLPRVYAGHMAGVWSFVYLPLVVLLVDRLFELRRPLLDTGLLALALGGSVLVGNPPGTIVILSGGVLYALWRLLAPRFGPMEGTEPGWGGRASWPGLTVIGLGLAAGALGALVAACQLLTTRDVLGETARRAGLGLAGASAYSLDPKALLTLASPTIFGGPGESYWGPSLPWEGSLYVGLAALALAVWGAWRGRSRGNVRFLVFAAAASLAVAMGSHLGLTTLIFRLVPATTAMRCPNRMALITQFALAALACHGTSVLALEDRLAPHARGAAAVRNVLAFAAFVAATAAITVSLQGPEGGLFAAAVRWLHGAEAAPGQAVTASVPAHDATAGALWSAALVAALGAAAVWVASHASRAGCGGAGREASEHRLESPRVRRQTELDKRAGCARSAAVAGAVVALAVFADLGWSMRSFVEPAPSSLSLVPAELLDRVTVGAGQRARVALVGSGFSQCAGDRQGFDTVNGYDQLISARLSDIGFMMEGREVGGSFAFYLLRSVHPVLDLMAADYVIAGRDAPVSRERYVEVASAGRLRLFRSQTAVPRCILVHRAKRVHSEDSSREIFFNRGFDPSSEALAEEDISGLAAPEASAQERVAIVAYRDDRVELDVTAAARGLLILSDSYSRGWTASVDGAGTRIIRANHLFRGVVVEPGAHRVVFEYRPAGARLGLVLTAAALALSAALIAAGAHRVSARPA